MNICVCVVGGTGFVGSHIVDAFLEEGDTVDVVDAQLQHGHNWWAFEKRKPAPMHISWSDVSSSGMLLENDYDVVVNAACKDLPFGISHPIQCYQDNINSLLSIISIMRSNPSGIKKLVHISSAEADHPSTFYGAAKASCDLIAEAARKQLRLNIVECYKPANVFGTRQLHLAIIPNTIRRWLMDKPIVINGSIDTVRGFVWGPELGKDIARHAKRDFLPSTLHKWSASIIEIIMAIKEAGLNGKFKIGPARPGDYTTERIYPPPDHAFVEHCTELIKWYRWWQKQPTSKGWFER